MRVLRVFHSGVVGAWRQRERALIARGVDVHLVSAEVWNEGGRPVQLQLDGDEFVEGAATLGNHPNLFVFDPRPLWRLLGQHWDLIDIHEEPCSLATLEILVLRSLRRCQAPFVLYSAQNIDKRYAQPFRSIEGVSLRKAAGLSACNTAAGRIVRRKGFRGALSVIPLGVDVAPSSPALRPAPSSGLRVGYFGRLEPHKGVPVAIEAVSQEPSMTLTIVGSGPEEAALRSQVATLGVADRIEFVGYVAPEAMAATYRGVDVVVVPSLPTPRWLEQFGRVVVEAMAAGVPVIASESGALGEVVGGAGILIPPGDAEALRARLRELAADPQRWTSLRDAGLARAASFTWEHVAADYEQLYRAAVNRSIPAGTVLAPSATGPGRLNAVTDASPTVLDASPTVVVVAYGPPDLMSECLAPLNGEFEVIIVDNSSLPETRALAAELGATYIDPAGNIGFGAAVNLGLAAAPAGVDVLLLNPDAAISADGVRGLQKALHSSDDLAAVAPVQRRPGSSVTVRVRWPWPSPALAWTQSIGLARLYRGHGGFLIGSVLLLSGAALADVGGFDEQFFLYAEETDWQRRATQLGWRLELVSQVSAEHAGGGTGGNPALRETFFHGSTELYIRKHFGPVGWLVYRVAVIAGAVPRSALLPGAARDKALFRLGLYLRGPIKVQRRRLQSSGQRDD